MTANGGVVTSLHMGHGHVVWGGGGGGIRRVVTELPEIGLDDTVFFLAKRRKGT